ncbi:hypothetical protein U1Q18_035730 [Sarracenia purpurea var. burkii]
MCSSVLRGALLQLLCSQQLLFRASWFLFRGAAGALLVAAVVPSSGASPVVAGFWSCLYVLLVACLVLEKSNTNGLRDRVVEEEEEVTCNTAHLRSTKVYNSSSNYMQLC